MNREIKTDLENILSLIACASYYGFESDVLFVAFREMLGSKLTQEEIEWYARSVEAEAGYGEEEYEAIIEQLEDFISKKRALAKLYIKAFRDIKEAYFINEPQDSKSNYWLNTILLNEELSSLRDELLAAAHAEKLFLRPPWQLLTELEMYRDCPAMDLSNAKDIQTRALNLPSSPKVLHGG